MSEQSWKESAVKHHKKMFKLVCSNEYRPSEEIIYTILELCGETGELANVLKKFMRSEKSVFKVDDVQMLIEEIADVRICIELVAHALNINLDDVAASKVVKNMDKLAMREMRVKGL